MTLTVQVPWSRVVANYGQTPDYTSGTKPNVIRDERPPPKHTIKERDGWRQPTTYSRIIENGWVTTFDLQSNLAEPYWDGFAVRYNVVVYAGAYGESYFYDTIPEPSIGLENKAIINALNKLKSIGSEEEFSVDLATAFAEREQASRLVLTSLKRIASGVRAARRMDARGIERALKLAPRNLKKNIKTPFELWLEYQYGWKPSLSDVYNTMNVLAYQEQERGKFTARVIATSRDQDEYSRSFTEYEGGYIDFEKHSRVSHKCKVRLDYVRTDTPAINDLKELGFTNPLLVAWELVPFSFVVDWFTPVGDYLSTLDATLGWSFRGGTCSITTEVRNSLSVTRTRSSVAGHTLGGSASAQGDSRQYKTYRIVYGDSPHPLLPYWKPKSSGMHVANGIALLASAFGGGGRHVK